MHAYSIDHGASIEGNIQIHRDTGGLVTWFASGACNVISLD